jgi:hypothetical protein
VTELRLREDAVHWRHVGGEVIAVDVDRSVYVGANVSGAVLWQELAIGTTFDALVDRLVSVFGIDRERAGADVSAFVDAVRAEGLLE